MRHYVIRLFVSFCILVFWSFQATSQTSVNSPVDLESWNRLAERAEAVIATARASNTALAILRTDLAEASRSISDAMIPLQEEIDLLNARLNALGEPFEGESEDGDLALQRAEINLRLLQVEQPFRFAADAVQHANGMMRQIDSIIERRAWESRATRGPFPLNPVHWISSAQLTADYFTAALSEISTSWASEAQREQFVRALPQILVWFVLGMVLLTASRAYVRQFANRIFPLSDGVPLRGGGFRLLTADVICPTAGLVALVAAAQSSQLISFFSETFITMMAVAAAIVFITNWLAKALFAGDGTELVQSCLGSDWSRTVRRTVRWLGWAVALRSASDGLQLDSGSQQAQIVILTFPALIVAAILMFQLSRRLSENLVALAQIDEHRPFSDVVFSGITWLAQAAAVVGVALAFGGYSVAGDYLVFPVLYSLALLGAFFALESIITGLISGLSARKGVDGSAVKTGIVRVCVGSLLLFAAVPVLALAWGATTSDIIGAWQAAVDGIPVGSQRITAMDVFRLVITFATGCVLTALIQSVLQRSVLPNTRLNLGAQRALITGVGYIGVILAGIAAVAMTNFDFTNIAIVAGALSVGIGFGLQTVVSNFVSGIILLVERPINVGDWIEVGGVSGTVRNVSVRATQIETFNRARVVVPNTDLIGGQVTNWTLENRRGRVILPIGVAYGTDTRQVEQILLEIANAHPSVMKDPSPSVVFMNFGADALEFELRVILYDVDFLLSTRSELNFAIADRFESEGISIPFPQRDIWVRNASELVAKEN